MCFSLRNPNESKLNDDESQFHALAHTRGTWPSRGNFEPLSERYVGMGNSSSKGPPIDEQCLAPWGVYPELQWDKPTAKAVKKLILDRKKCDDGS